MFGRPIPLFKLMGFEVRVDASWLIIAALVVWSLAAGLFPQTYPGLSAGAYWWMGIGGAVGLFLSIIVHELFHSLVARRYGLHMKGITLFIFGGIAEMRDEPPSARAEFLMAIAGPLASVGIGLACYLAWIGGRGLLPVPILGTLGYLYWINWILAAFNMIPAFPLDGGRVLRSALWHWKGDLRRATRVASSIGAGFGFLLMAFAVFQFFRGSFIAALWWFLIGMFVRNAALASYDQVLLRSALQNEPVARFMSQRPIVAPPETSLQELVDDYVYRHHHKMFPVVAEDGRVVGCVGTRQARAVPREEWPKHSVAELAEPCSPENAIGPDTDAMKALSIMNRTGATRLLVVDRGRLVGIVTLKDLLSFLSTKLELEGEGAGKASRILDRRDRAA